MLTFLVLMLVVFAVVMLPAQMAGAGATHAQHLNASPSLDALIEQYNLLVAFVDKVWKRLTNGLCALNGATFADATAAGKIKIVGGTVEFKVNGEHQSKGAADPAWDFTAEVDVAAAKYRAYWLYLAADGTPSFAAVTTTGTDAASAVAAKAALAAAGEPAADKAVVGVFVAGPSTDMSADAIVAKAGATMEYGIPEDMIPVMAHYTITKD